MLRQRISFVAITLLPACATTPPQEDPSPACRALLKAQPALWPERWQAVRAFGPRAVPALIRALEANSDGPGAQAAVHLLGDLGTAAAGKHLRTVLEDPTSLATEAALALGRTGDLDHVAALRAVVHATTRQATTRVAAAAALIDLGAGAQIHSFLYAVFVAATPYASESTRRHHLPRRKTRWAHERYMLIEALRRRYDGRTFGLDEDLSWPELRRGATRLQAFLRKQG